MKTLITLLSICMLTTLSYGQGYFVDGWIVDNNGNKTIGQIFSKDWNQNPSSITFKSGQKEQNYYVQDLQSFGLSNGSLVYNRFFVTYHTTPVSESTEYPENDETVETRLHFLKLMVPGNFTLYELSLQRNYFFYAISKDSVVELQYGKGTKNYSAESFRNDPRYGKNLIFENLSFRTQLLNMANTLNRDDLGDKITNINYDESALTKLFEAINSSKRLDKSKMSIKFGLGAGFGLSNGKVVKNKNTGIVANATFENASFPFFTSSLELGSSNPLKRTSFIANIMFSKINAKGSRPANINLEKSVVYKMDNSYFDINFGVRYKLNPQHVTKVFLDLGFNATLLIPSTNEVAITDLSDRTLVNSLLMKKTNVAPFAAIGATYSKFVFTASYISAISNTNYVNTNYGNSRILLGVCFQLTK